MAAGSTALDGLIAAIVTGDQQRARQQLAADPELARARVAVGATRAEARAHFIDDIGHYVYAGDSALHIAAAAHSPPLVTALTAAGADVGATHRRGASPLHYAVDRGGVTPLHRAIRNRCAAAVAVLLANGADARRPNGRGSTPQQLARWTTGKGGSGSDAAKEQQARILRLLEEHGAASR